MKIKIENRVLKTKMLSDLKYGETFIFSPSIVSREDQDVYIRAYVLKWDIPQDLYPVCKLLNGMVVAVSNRQVNLVSLDVVAHFQGD